MHGIRSIRSIRYWILQYLLASVTMFAILVAVDLIGGAGAKLADGIWMSLAWALAASAIFIGARYKQSRKP
ncbi:MAG: hypothetical protein QFF03_18355 [Pseudomonadota bacterium]|nr:hypothetical protein [Pseudomonadota bacterium]